MPPLPPEYSDSWSDPSRRGGSDEDAAPLETILQELLRQYDIGFPVTDGARDPWVVSGSCVIPYEESHQL